MLFLSDLFSHPGSLDHERRAQITRIVVRWSWAAVGVFLIAAFVLGFLLVPDKGALYDMVLQSRWALFRLVVGLGLIVIGTYAALVIYNALENTETGKRLIVPDETDFSGLHTIKVSNAGTILGFLFFACVGGLLLGVLR
jgi:cytochrome c biogenesis protein CcdA